jgi:hypothetical protein
LTRASAQDLPINPAVTQATIDQTICVPGWTKTVRPSARYAARIKIKLIRELELPKELLTDFELDLRIPLALGGAPSALTNLELQPWDEAAEKDAVEACLSRAAWLARSDWTKRAAGYGATGGTPASAAKWGNDGLARTGKSR